MRSCNILSILTAFALIVFSAFPTVAHPIVHAAKRAGSSAIPDPATPRVVQPVPDIMGNPPSALAVLGKVAAAASGLSSVAGHAKAMVYNLGFPYRSRFAHAHHSSAKQPSACVDHPGSGVPSVNAATLHVLTPQISTPSHVLTHQRPPFVESVLTAASDVPFLGHIADYVLDIYGTAPRSALAAVADLEI